MVRTFESFDQKLIKNDLIKKGEEVNASITQALNMWAKLHFCLQCNYGPLYRLLQEILKIALTSIHPCFEYNTLVVY